MSFLLDQVPRIGTGKYVPWSSKQHRKVRFCKYCKIMTNNSLAQCCIVVMYFIIRIFTVNPPRTERNYI